MKASTALFPFLIIASTLNAQDTTLSNVQDTTFNQSRYATSIDAEEASKGSWIGMNGSVKAAGGKSFILQLGEETVAVGLTGEELREQQFEAGSDLIVFGRVHKDLFERRVIKARAIKIDGQEQVLGERDSIMGIASPEEGSIVIHGRVSAMDGRIVTLGEDDHKIILDAGELSVDPSGVDAGMGISVGHLVTATGNISKEFWTDRTIKVTSLNVMAYGDGGDEQKAGTDRDPDERDE